MDSQDEARVRKDNGTIENSIDPLVEDSATHVCRCGNPVHTNLLQWIEKPEIPNYWDLLESDSLDMEQIDREVKKAQETILVVDEYCSSCRKFLEALPDILINQPPTKYNPINRPHFQNMAELIYVGGKIARLVITSTLGHRLKYATLSHCWGAIPYLMLKTTSIDSMMIKIPEDNLTKTFQDAIRISRALGIEYIWIDSLCIIQDSSSDWQAEAVLMQSVYSNLEINIATTWAADGRQGCFLQPQDYIAKVHVRNLKPPSDKSWDISNLSDDLDYIPLTRRAWVLQERLLSTRTLHFSEREMIWECKTGGARENFLRIVKRKQEKTSLAHMWDDIVRQYTNANLTKTSDKLIAIGGIARATQLESGDRYLAGLWEKDIEVKLLWWKDDQSTKSDVYRAPSWYVESYIVSSSDFLWCNYLFLSISVFTTQNILR
ncbi:hypothetical protein ACHAQE_009922 [Botrytis cinerea]